MTPKLSAQAAREDWPQAHTKREDATIEQARCKPLDWLLGARP